MASTSCQHIPCLRWRRFHQKKNRSIIDKPPGTEEIPLVTDVSQGSSQWLPSRVSGRGRKPRQGPTHANTRPKAPGMAAIGATRGQKGALARQQRLLHATVSSFNCKPSRGHLFRHVSDRIHYLVQFLDEFHL